VTRPNGPRLLVYWTMLVCGLAWTGLVRADEPLRVGVAEVEITPPVGFRMQGSYGKVLATGVKAPLLAKGLVFEQGDCSCSIVINDLCGVTRELIVETAVKLLERLGGEE
jgi:neutral ceramidase